jgi:transposase
MALLRMLGDQIDALIGDKGYDSDAIRDELETSRVRAVIPSKSTRRHPAAFARDLYKQRNLIDRMFNKLKNWRRIATHYDKTASSFLAFVPRIGKAVAALCPRTLAGRLNFILLFCTNLQSS